MYHWQFSTINWIEKKHGITISFYYTFKNKMRQILFILLATLFKIKTYIFKAYVTKPLQKYDKSCKFEIKFSIKRFITTTKEKYLQNDYLYTFGKASLLVKKIFLVIVDSKFLLSCLWWLKLTKFSILIHSTRHQ